jgi:hypothetical protein
MRYGTCLVALAVAIAGCRVPGHQNLPPAQMLMHPGPGVEGPGPGVMMYQPIMPVPPQTSQIWFVGPDGMQVNWDVSAPGAFDSQPFICPGRQNFQEGAIYRLKLTNIPGRPGVELYPTLEIAPAMPRTQAFLAHNAIPVQFTQEDFDQVLSGNFVTKVIYLPDPEFQELALAGVETLVSTRLEPGVDPIVEADRRGAILAVVRLGNKDLQIPGSNPAAGVTQAAYLGPVANGRPVPMQPPMVGGPGLGAGTYISGVTGPQYGMPMSGTPIGLPGPPHVPLGAPAGLQRHTIVNHTCVHLPDPTKHVRIDVKQEPGMSYPKPANHATIVEQTSAGAWRFGQPHADKREVVRPDGTGAPCPQEASGGDPNGN